MAYLRSVLLVSACSLFGAAPGLAQTGTTDSATEGRTLRPGDVVQLRIWREPDLSGEFLIDESGVVVFPRLGEIRVVDYGASSLEELLVDEYRRYLRNPSIDVIVRRRVNVSGAVRNPGLYTVDPTVTIADAIAMAGGVTTLGRQDGIQLIRDGNVLLSDLSIGSRIADSPVQSGDQLFVPERSWVSRNAGVVAASIGAVVTIAVALLR